MRPATTYSPNAELGVSTIGPDRLNGRVRNGNGCIPVGNITGLTILLNWTGPCGPGGSLVERRCFCGDAIVPIVSGANYLLIILAINRRTNKSLHASPSSAFCGRRRRIEEYGQAARAISTASLNASQRLHSQPIKQVVFLRPLGVLRPRET